MELFPDQGNLRRSFVYDVAASIAEGLRSSSAKNNVRQTSDFVNGMLFAGLLLEKGRGAHRSFVKAFKEGLPEMRRVVENDNFTHAQDIKARMARHSIGPSDMTPGEMLVTVGLSAEGVIREIGEEQGLEGSELMDVVTFAVVLAIVATTRPEALDLLFAKIIESVEHKAGVWNEIIPSEEEIWGDDVD
ncbi:hypothetical protein ACOI1H_14580 [Loktanella sp. DJP18]|uniref:hypothetical protein n=1 Tax=Loktanella sp. DJP18 TaxID=3409788 RepID=UPI003BB5DEAC